MEKFAKIVNLLDANYHIIWGNANEELLAKEIKKHAPDVRICAKLSIENLSFFISQLDLVIGPDTGPTHIAWALNIPSITIYGPTPGYRNTYETNINRIIESESKVNPKKINKSDYSIKNIDADKILKLANELLYTK